MALNLSTTLGFKWPRSVRFFSLCSRYSDSLRVGRSRVRIPVEARFSALVLPATGRTVRGSNAGGGKIFRTRQGRPWGHPASYTMGTGSISPG